MPTNARRRHRIDTGGPWGSGLLTTGIALIAQGVSYVASQRHSLTDALGWISHAVPIAAWGGLWVGAGLYSVTRALMPPQRHVDVVPAVAVICLWSAIYFVHWLSLGFGSGDWTREWASAVAWGSLACLLICFSRTVNPPTGRR